MRHRWHVVVSWQNVRPLQSHTLKTYACVCLCMCMCHLLDKHNMKINRNKKLLSKNEQFYEIEIYKLPSLFSWFRHSIFLAKPTASSQSISQQRQYLGRAPADVVGGVTGAKYAWTLIFGRWFCWYQTEEIKCFFLWIFSTLFHPISLAIPQIIQ